MDAEDIRRSIILRSVGYPVEDLSSTSAVRQADSLRGLASEHQAPHPSLEDQSQTSAWIIKLMKALLFWTTPCPSSKCISYASRQDEDDDDVFDLQYRIANSKKLAEYVYLGAKIFKADGSITDRITNKVIKSYFGVVKEKSTPTLHSSLDAKNSGPIVLRNFIPARPRSLVLKKDDEKDIIKGNVADDGFGLSHDEFCFDAIEMGIVARVRKEESEKHKVLPIHMRPWDSNLCELVKSEFMNQTIRENNAELNNQIVACLSRERKSTWRISSLRSEGSDSSGSISDDDLSLSDPEDVVYYNFGSSIILRNEQL